MKFLRKKLKIMKEKMWKKYSQAMLNKQFSLGFTLFNVLVSSQLSGLYVKIQLCTRSVNNIFRKFNDKQHRAGMTLYIIFGKKSIQLPLSERSVKRTV